MPKRKEKRHTNQRGIYIHKEISHTKKDYYTLDVKRTNIAMSKLSGTAFKMYIYLNENFNNQMVLFSLSKFSKKLDISESACRTAKQELITNRYLMLREDGDYNFYNHPYRNHNETVFEKFDRINSGSAFNKTETELDP